MLLQVAARTRSWKAAWIWSGNGANSGSQMKFLNSSSSLTPCVDGMDQQSGQRDRQVTPGCFRPGL